LLFENSEIKKTADLKYGLTNMYTGIQSVSKYAMMWIKIYKLGISVSLFVYNSDIHLKLKDIHSLDSSMALNTQ